jgi:accessory colonization factor AcfC
MALITLRPASTWSETLLHRFDVIMDRAEQAVRDFFADKQGDFRQAAHAAQVRRLAARGGNGQALF